VSPWRRGQAELGCRPLLLAAGPGGPPGRLRVLPAAGSGHGRGSAEKGRQVPEWGDDPAAWQKVGKAITGMQRETVVVKVGSVGCGTKIRRKSGFIHPVLHGMGWFTWVCCIKKKGKKSFRAVVQNQILFL